MFGVGKSQNGTRQRPESSYIFFLLVVGVMVGLAVWSVATAPKLRTLPEESGTRDQLQAELRSLVKAPPLPPPGLTTGTAERQQIAQDDAGWSPSWTWVGLIMIIGSAFAVWAMINFYASSVEDLDGDAGPAPGTHSGGDEHPTRRRHSTPEWMKTAIRMGRDGVIGIEAGGKVMSANPVAEKLLGYESGRLPGRTIFEVLPDLGSGPDDLRRFSQVTAPTKVKAKKRDGSEAPLQLALHRAGEGQYVVVFSTPEAPKSAPAPAATAAPAAASPAAPAPPQTATINQDALRGLENQLVMLSGYSELLAAAMPEGESDRADADAVVRAAARATLLCHEVAPASQPHPRAVDLNGFVVAAAPKIAALLDPDCEVKAVSSPLQTEVWADPELLDRSIGSLAWRAQEWAGGLKSVQLSNSNGRVDVRILTKGKAEGATRAAFDRLPAIDWVEAQNGTIEMEEHSGMGLRFRIWMPAATAPAKQAQPAAADPDNQTSQRRTSNAAD